MGHETLVGGDLVHVEITWGMSLVRRRGRGWGKDVYCF